MKGVCEWRAKGMEERPCQVCVLLCDSLNEYTYRSLVG